MACGAGFLRAFKLCFKFGDLALEFTDHMIGALVLGDLAEHALQQFQAAGIMDALERLAEASDSARGFADFEGYRQVLLGRVDAMVDPDVKPYDICAPAVLVREAGGRFSSLEGVDTIYGGGAIASNGRVHDALVATLRAS